MAIGSPATLPRMSQTATSIAPAIAVRQVVGVPVEPAKLVPQRLARDRVLADDLRGVQVVEDVGHRRAVAQVGVLHRVADDALVGVEGVERVLVPASS